MPHSQKAYQTEQLLGKKFFNTIFSLESDQITALRANFTFYVLISNSIANWTTFVKEFSDLMLSSEIDKITVVWLNDS